MSRHEKVLSEVDRQGVIREFDNAFELLTELVDLSEADEIMESSPQTVYTASVVLWLLLVQRLDRNASLRDAVAHLIETKPDFLPHNKRLGEGTLSPGTGAYSNGRQRLTMETVMWLAESVSQSLIDTCPSSFDHQRVFLLDGTTLTLAPEEELQEALPPATNQYGPSPWPLMHLVVAHELESGTALPPEFGAKNGPHAVSETALIFQHMQRIPAGSIILADANFGILRVADAAERTDHRYALRMTKQRFQSLRRKATLVAEGPGWKTYEHQWTPTPRERQNNPQFSEHTALAVRLHEVRINDNAGKEVTLLLVTDLAAEALEVAELYALRWNVETDIANLKIVLDVENIRAKSYEMVIKELMIASVAYNLTCQFRREASRRANVPSRRLSFTGVWGKFRIFLLTKIFTTAEDWRLEYERALQLAMKEKLPNRPGRSYPREAYRRRPKSTHFQKRIPRNRSPESTKKRPK